jgi:type III secretion protein V
MNRHARSLASASLVAGRRSGAATASGLAALARGAGRQSDLALAALLVAIVALFVLPLPTALLDFLITANLAISVALLIVVMYVPNALSLSTFPSLLLFTTLFRLALNIASTKLILLNANAGQIIDTFGRLIVGNNVVVGGVVFLIIAVVQFIVIAKGSERVAEVAARFALDAMPGKQMSIDADVRAGVLSTVEAQRRRRALEQECQLHGSMDGAMKFVKGDAIAGIVIALINILAGVAIGTLMHGMDIGAALQRYAVLTVGDGMVSQIPSLLVSIAAGIVITRVAAEEGGPRTHLAEEIGRQVLAQPKALIVAGLAFSSFLLVPGFPVWTFAAWALVVGGLGWWMLGRKAQRESAADRVSRVDVDGAVAAAHRDSDRDEVGTVRPLSLRLDRRLDASLAPQTIDRATLSARQVIERELGPVFPWLQVQIATLADERAYELLVQDVVVASGRIEPPREGEQTDTDDAAQPQLARHLETVVLRHAAHLLGLQDVQRFVQRVQRDAPELTAELARTMPLQRVHDVLRRLLQEGVPVRNLRAIFESLVAWGPKEGDPIALTELVRIDLGRYITSRHVAPDRRLDAIPFETALLNRIEQSIERSPRGNLLLLSPAATQEIREQLRGVLAATGGRSRAAVVVSSDVRRYVKTLIEPAAPEVPVLSYQELDDDVALQPIGWITNPAAP